MQRDSELRPVTPYQPTLSPMHDERDERVTLLDVVAPVLEGWRTLLLMVVLALVVAGSLIFLTYRAQYEAEVRLAAVSSQRMPSLGALGGLASLAGLSPQQGGLNASPLLIAEFLHSREVLRQVGTEVVASPDGGRTRIVDLVTRKDSGALPAWQIEREMNKVLRTNVSDKTGLISLGVRSSDSGLARHIAMQLVERARASYVHTARAQAAELRRAQTARVDSAQRQLRSAEERLVEFRASNRVIVPYSATSVRQTQLEGAVEIARQIQMQAIVDREAAVAKELEETPAMVVVDPIPPAIPPLPGHRASKTLALAFVVAVLTAIWLVIRDGLQHVPPSRRAKIERVRRAAGTLPMVGSRFRAP